MIVLDEQLLGRGIEHHIAQWYRGTVQFITNIRPNTVIKDDAIPMLLRQLSQPTFVTINARDFWQRVSGGPAVLYGVLCLVGCPGHRHPPGSARAIPSDGMSNKSPTHGEDHSDNK